MSNPQCNRQIGVSMVNLSPIICGGKMIETGWLPEPGLDQRLREFKCQNCGEKQYYRVPSDEKRVNQLPGEVSTTEAVARTKGE